MVLMRIYDKSDNPFHAIMRKDLAQNVVNGWKNWLEDTVTKDDDALLVVTAYADNFPRSQIDITIKMENISAITLASIGTEGEETT